VVLQDQKGTTHNEYLDVPAPARAY
jgi:hypothetical protein